MSDLVIRKRLRRNCATDCIISEKCQRHKSNPHPEFIGALKYFGDRKPSMLCSPSGCKGYVPMEKNAA